MSFSGTSSTYAIASSQGRLMAISSEQGWRLELFRPDAERASARCDHPEVGYMLGAGMPLCNRLPIPWTQARHLDDQLHLTGNAEDDYGNRWQAETVCRILADGHLGIDTTLRLERKAEFPWARVGTGWGGTKGVNLRLPWRVAADPRTAWCAMPGLSYGGNRADGIVRTGYCPSLPFIDLKAYGADRRPVRLLGDIPRQDAGTGWTIDAISHNPATPDVLVLDRADGTGLMLGAARRDGDRFTGLTHCVDPDLMRHEVVLSIPGVRRRRYCVLGFHNVDDPAWVPEQGESITLRTTAAAIRASAPDDLFELQRASWARRRTDVPDTMPRSEIVRIATASISARNWDEERGFYWAHEKVDDPRTLNSCMILQLGWVWGCEVMHPLFRQGDATTRTRVRRMLTFLLDSGAQAPSGLFRGQYDTFTWYPRPHRTAAGYMDWFEAMAGSASRTTDTVRHGFRLLDALREADPADPLADRWEDALRRAIAGLREVLRRHGCVPYMIDPDSLDAWWQGGAGGALALDLFAEASKRWGDDGIIAEASAYAARLATTHLDSGEAWGRPVDCLSAINYEAHLSMLGGFLGLWRVTRAEAHLRWARQAAQALRTWQVPDAIPFPAGSRLARNGLCTAGTMIANVQNSCGTPALCTDSGRDLLDLYEITGETWLMDMLQAIIRCSFQQLVREGQDWGHLKPGQLTECQPHSDTMQEFGDSYIVEATWVSAAYLLQQEELPNLYVDGDRIWRFDHLRATIAPHGIRVENPTDAPAQGRVAWRDGGSATFTIAPRSSSWVRPAEAGFRTCHHA
jgi:hypothetical protein